MADGFLSGWRSSTRDIRDDAEDYGRRAGERLRDARDTAEEYGRRTGARMRDRGEDARGELSRLWSQLEDLVERRIAPAASDAADTARSYARHAGSYARDGREMAYDVADQIRDVTRSRPLVAIGVAVAATWLIATMLRSGRR